MARSGLTVYPVSRLFILLDTAAPFVAGDVANGMTCANDGATTIQAINTDAGGSHTFTVQAPVGADVNLTTSSRTYTVPASGRGKTGPFEVAVYGPQLLIDVSDARITLRATTTRG